MVEFRIGQCLGNCPPQSRMAALQAFVTRHLRCWRHSSCNHKLFTKDTKFSNRCHLLSIYSSARFHQAIGCIMQIDCVRQEVQRKCLKNFDVDRVNFAPPRPPRRFPWHFEDVDEDEDDPYPGGASDCYRGLITVRTCIQARRGPGLQLSAKARLRRGTFDLEWKNSGADFFTGMDEQKIYYFDNNATTRVAPQVVEAMLPFLTTRWGNPSSAYAFGRAVAGPVEEARARAAALINADPREIVFTSCGTESNNSAIHSALMTNPGKRHVVTTAVEHSATIKFCEHLQKRGYEATFLPVESDGSLDLHRLTTSIRPDTAIVSVMWANNETGVIFPVEEIAAICHSKGVLCHTDAVQTAGKLKMDVQSLGVDFLSLSAHKFHAPKGIGLLYVKRRTRFQPYLIGGHQERERRGGAENVPHIFGPGRAAELGVATFGKGKNPL